MQIQLIGAAIDQCANVRGAALTPEIINSHLSGQDLLVNPILHYLSDGHDISELKTYFTNLADTVYKTLNNETLPVVIGGDHSCAIGSWHGVAKYLADHNQSLGLIWIDAHMDSHTPQTTITGNIHGMPLATLLGYGYPELINILDQNPALKPDNLVLIGIRSYEAAEATLLEKLGVKIYYNHDIAKHGFAKIFNQAWQQLANQVDKVGLTIDMDGFDPKFAPGVSTPEPKGIDFNDFMQAFRHLDPTKLAVVEIAETNSSHDVDNKTINCVLEIIKATSLLT